MVWHALHIYTARLESSSVQTGNSVWVEMGQRDTSFETAYRGPGFNPPGSVDTTELTYLCLLVWVKEACSRKADCAHFSLLEQQQFYLSTP